MVVIHPTYFSFLEVVGGVKKEGATRCPRGPGFNYHRSCGDLLVRRMARRELNCYIESLMLEIASCCFFWHLLQDKASNSWHEPSCFAAICFAEGIYNMKPTVQWLNVKHQEWRTEIILTSTTYHPLGL